MARCPLATWRPLPEDATQPSYNKTLVILHSQGFNDDDGTLWDDFNRPGNNLESTFFIRWDGHIEQYLDSTRRADANRFANEEAISIETEDDGDPDNQPWSPAQMDAIVNLVAWCCDVHGIPRIRATGCFGEGVGYHTMWGAPSCWTPVVKTCPGRVRKFDQFPIILNRLQNPPPPPPPQGFLMALSDAEQQEVLNGVRNISATLAQLPVVRNELSRIEALCEALSASQISGADFGMVSDAVRSVRGMVEGLLKRPASHAEVGRNPGDWDTELWDQFSWAGSSIMD